MQIRDFESEWIRTNFWILMNPGSEVFKLEIRFKTFWTRISVLIGRLRLDFNSDKKSV